MSNPPVVGKFQIVDSNGKPMLTIDPDSGFVQIVQTTPSGFHVMEVTNTAALNLFAAGNDFGARLDGSTGILRLGANGIDAKVHVRNNFSNDVIVLDASDASIQAGGLGGFAGSSNGRILVLDGDGKVKITLTSAAATGGTEGEVALFTSSATSSDASQAVIHLRASPATIRAGLPNVSDGQIWVSGKASNTITLDGGSGDISLSNGRILVLGSDGKPMITLTRAAATGGTEGEVALFTSSATSSDAQQAVIHLAASHNSRATVRAGLPNVSDGQILVTGKASKTITLDGSSGDIILSNGDCAEEFDVAESEQIEPGAVVVFDAQGQIRRSSEAYDRKVAGIISGAGDYKPGIVLDRRASSETRMPVALLGKVYCNADATYAPIEVGDLLTTSTTPGHAMKACEPIKAFGAVLGKALQSLPSGRGQIRVLVALQ